VVFIVADLLSARLTVRWSRHSGCRPCCWSRPGPAANGAESDGVHEQNDSDNSEPQQGLHDKIDNGDDQPARQESDDEAMCPAIRCTNSELRVSNEVIVLTQ
jgi:hypothetical protein